MLALCDLVFLALAELVVIVAPQFKYVLRELIGDSCERVPTPYLVVPLQPVVDLLQHLVYAVAVLHHQDLVQGRELDWRLARLLAYLVQRLEHRVEQVEEMRLGDKFGPMRGDQKISSPEKLALLVVSPLVVLYELQHVVHVEALLELDLVLALDFAYDTNKVQEGVLLVDVAWLDLAGEVLVKNFLDEGVANVVELLKQLLDQVLGEEVDGAVVLQVVLQQELLVLVLDEILWVVLPGAEIDLRQEPLRDELQDFPCAVLPVLLVFVLRVRDGCLQHLSVELAGHGYLGLQILELDRGYEDADAVRVSRGVVLAPLVVNVDIHYFECGAECQFLNSQRVYLAAEQDFSQSLQVLIERVEHEQGLKSLQIRQSLQESLHLTDKDLLELLLLGAVRHVVDLLAALYEHLELLYQVGYFLDVAIILGLRHKVVDAEATCHDEHEALV